MKTTSDALRQFVVTECTTERLFCQGRGKQQLFVVLHGAPFDRDAGTFRDLPSAACVLVAVEFLRRHPDALPERVADEGFWVLSLEQLQHFQNALRTEGAGFLTDGMSEEDRPAGEVVEHQELAAGAGAAVPPLELVGRGEHLPDSTPVAGQEALVGTHPADATPSANEGKTEGERA